MAKNNFQRMLQLADEAFAVKNDPNQLDVDQEVIARLQSLHPASVGELDLGEGPVCWVLLIPTTRELMHRFLQKEISEKELFELTSPGQNYQSVYLCSGMVLDEYRRQGIAKKLCLDALQQIRADHPIESLFVWTFSEAGLHAARSIAQCAELPLLSR
ncbi:MAG: hypothetical protein H6581_11815 [Bacteroidia bacterium]|nr:hypothetical protein [Bacteroidia bacterium]